VLPSNIAPHSGAHAFGNSERFMRNYDVQIMIYVTRNFCISF